MTETAVMDRQMFKVEIFGFDPSSVLLKTRRSAGDQDAWVATIDEAREIILRLGMDASTKPRTYHYGWLNLDNRPELEIGAEVPREHWPEW